PSKRHPGDSHHATMLIAQSGAYRARTRNPRRDRTALSPTQLTLLAERQKCRGGSPQWQLFALSFLTHCSFCFSFGSESTIEETSFAQHWIDSLVEHFG